jgi:hypothetical protein
MHGLGARQGACGTRSSLGHSSSGVSLPGRALDTFGSLHPESLLFALTGASATHAGASATRRQRTVSVRAETKPLSPLEVLKRENELLKQVR